MNPEQGFFRLCTAYDTFAKIAVGGFQGIDKGEAEIYAQFKKVGMQVVISDDKRFKIALGLLDPGIKVYNTLHLLCWLDIANLMADWEEMVRKIHPVRPFNAADLRTAYTEILQKFGIDKPKKEVNKKCDLQTILAN